MDMRKQSTSAALCCALLLICAVTASGDTRQDGRDSVNGRAPTVKRLWQNLNDRLHSSKNDSPHHSRLPSGQRQPTPGELYPDEEWVIWYVDTFDRDFPPRSEVSGRGLVEGLAQLWARHLFESVRPDGQSGFSSF